MKNIPAVLIVNTNNYANTIIAHLSCMFYISILGFILITFYVVELLIK